MISIELKRKIGDIAENCIYNKQIARKAIEDFIRKNRFNSAVRNEITDYFYQVVRFFGLYKKYRDINQQIIDEFIEKREYNEKFVADLLCIDDEIASLVAKDITKEHLLSLLKRAPLSIRVNTLKTTRELLKLRYDFFEDTEVSPFGLFTDKHINVRQLNEFKKGEFEIQDEASQLIYFLVNPKSGDLILDICAGTGGKSLHLLSTGLNVNLFAYDTNVDRLNLLKKRAKIAGVNVKILNTLKGKFQKVLIDAPCSGSGSLRRDVDTLFRIDSSKLNLLIELQRKIFDEAYNLTEKGGFIVYTTCSFFECENEMQVKFFMDNYKLEVIDAKHFFDKKLLEKLNRDLCTLDNVGDNTQMGRHKNLLFAHSRSASMHCSEAAAIPKPPVRNNAAETAHSKFLCLSSCAKVSNIDRYFKTSPMKYNMDTFFSCVFKVL
jgi:16S rRNA (cytosine967-C5)-methyltransferase